MTGGSGSTISIGTLVKLLSGRKLRVRDGLRMKNLFRSKKAMQQPWKGIAYEVSSSSKIFLKLPILARLNPEASAWRSDSGRRGGCEGTVRTQKYYRTRSTSTHEVRTTVVSSSATMQGASRNCHVATPDWRISVASPSMCRL